MGKIGNIMTEFGKVLQDFLKDNQGKPYGYIKVNFQDGNLTTIEKQNTYKPDKSNEHKD